MYASLQEENNLKTRISNSGLMLCILSLGCLILISTVLYRKAHHPQHKNVQTQAAQSDTLAAIAIQPLAPCNAAHVESVRRVLMQRFRVEVTVLPAVTLPKDAYYRPRNRYRAETILTWLETHTDPRFVKIVGMTDSDISITKGNVYDWGVFGLGTMGARTCVISTFRLGGNSRRGQERLEKVALHETGHTFGLPHCQTQSCLMNDYLGSIHTVDQDTDFCERCKGLLGHNLRQRW